MHESYYEGDYILGMIDSFKKIKIFDWRGAPFAPKEKENQFGIGIISDNELGEKIFQLLNAHIFPTIKAKNIKDEVYPI